MVRRYITAKEFNDFGKNQNELINVLNHNMTKLGVDVCWLKKLVGWQMGLIGAIGVSIIVSIIRLGGV